MASLVAGNWGNLPGAASTETPELCLTSSLERKLESSRLAFCSALIVEYSATTPRFSAASPSGRSRSISSVLWLDSWAMDTAKLQASVVTPSPPLAPRNTSSLPPVFFGGARRRTARRGPDQRFGHGTLRKGHGEKLARARAHAAHQQLRIGLHRVDHHRRRAVGADALHQLQRIFGMAVQVDDDDVVIAAPAAWAHRPGSPDRKKTRGFRRSGIRRALWPPPCGDPRPGLPALSTEGRRRESPDTGHRDTEKILNSRDCYPLPPANLPCGLTEDR